MTYPSDPNRPEFAFGARARQSPYFDRARAAGACMYTLYNHMVMPVSYGRASGAEYDRLMNHASVWDVAAERQVQLKGPDAQKLAQMMSPRDVAPSVRLGQGFYTRLSSTRPAVSSTTPFCSSSKTSCSGCPSPTAMSASTPWGWLTPTISTSRSPNPTPHRWRSRGPKAEDVVAHAFGERVRDIRYFWFVQTEVAGHSRRAAAVGLVQAGRLRDLLARCALAARSCGIIVWACG